MSQVVSGGRFQKKITSEKTKGGLILTETLGGGKSKGKQNNTFSGIPATMQLGFRKTLRKLSFWAISDMDGDYGEKMRE